MLDSQIMAGGACDGTSVMLGVHNGVVSRLKAKVPHFIHTHCGAHRLSLAASHASSASKCVQRFKSMMNQIYAFYSRSSTRTTELRYSCCQERLNCRVTHLSILVPVGCMVSIVNNLSL